MRVGKHSQADPRLRQPRPQPAFQPVVARIDHPDLGVAPLLQPLGEISRGAQLSTGGDMHAVPAPFADANVLGERRPMQHQFLKVKPFVREEQRVFNQHAVATVGQAGMMLIQLVRIDERGLHDVDSPGV